MFLFILLFFIGTQVNRDKDKLLKDREWLPDLQLRLAQRIGIDDDQKIHRKNMHQISTQLSLS